MTPPQIETKTIQHFEHFDDVKSVVDSFDRGNAESIASAQQLFGDAQIKIDLAYIKANFSSICFAIKKLETQGLSLSESVRMIESIKNSLQSLPRQQFHDKFQSVLNRNPGYEKIIQINNAIERGILPTDQYVSSLTPMELASFKYCPVTSSDVERVFSRYGNILTDNRQSFLFENLKQHMIVNCNALK